MSYGQTWVEYPTDCILGWPDCQPIPANKSKVQHHSLYGPRTYIGERALAVAYAKAIGSNTAGGIGLAKILL